MASPGLVLADTVARLRRAMRRAARAADPDCPLTVAQLEVLSCLAAVPGARPSQVARHMRLSPNSVTTLVNALYTRGLVTRSRAAGDARAFALSLTADGHSVLARWMRTNAVLVHTALAGLGPHHQRVLAKALPALDALARGIDTLADAPPQYLGG
ncbi:MarR family winged helix-turn-helix transcriptional regulator [Sphaerisporangium rufum]|uniref:MarR family winged helix-turn-helix transcriptional regulator n=1 Tax=Sphaerisporangium rufum TaxID=1381558 RepID=UPI001EF19A08|nr:MarR family winged helix-turn-helix transcriptional regulator [Sphaerisporangium rufum]